jgi:leucyl-tRNA synthetase
MRLTKGGVLDGSKPGPAGIEAKDMTDEVWSYIMLEGPKPKQTPIPLTTLESMRKEFEYYYPLDLRCSGKDLINNHLTFFIYNHTAVFPKKNWPRAVRANGHLLLNNMKMSKSTGNFLTLGEALERYGADATRFALADAGDGLEDANFLEKTADDVIVKLFNELEWIKENVLAKDILRTGPLSWNDKVFSTEIDSIVMAAEKAYDSMLFREALKLGFYDLQNARNEYRKATTGQGLTLSGEVFEGMHKDLLYKFVETEVLLLSPLIPHWSENIWMEILKKVPTCNA